MITELSGKIEGDSGFDFQRELYLNQLGSLFKPSEEIESARIRLQRSAEYELKYVYEYYDMANKLDTGSLSSLSEEIKKAIRDGQNILKGLSCTNLYNRLEKVFQHIKTSGDRQIKHLQFVEAYQIFKRKTIIPAHGLDIYPYLDFMIKIHTQRWTKLLDLVLFVEKKMRDNKYDVSQYIMPVDKVVGVIAAKFLEKIYFWQTAYYEILGDFEQIEASLADIYYMEVAYALFIMRDRLLIIQPQVDADVESIYLVETKITEKKNKFRSVLEYFKNRIHKK